MRNYTKILSSIVLLFLCSPFIVSADWVQTMSVVYPQTFEYEFTSLDDDLCFVNSGNTSYAENWGIVVTAADESVLYQATTSDASYNQSLSYTLSDVGEAFINAYCDIPSLSLYSLGLGSTGFYYNNNDGSQYLYNGFPQVVSSVSSTSSTSSPDEILAMSALTGVLLFSFVIGLIMSIWIFKSYILS